MRKLQEILNRQAGTIQREFTATGKELAELSNQIVDLKGEARKQVLDKQNALHQKQQSQAEEINLWRNRSREVLLKGRREALHGYIEDLMPEADPQLRDELKHILYLLDRPEEAAVILGSATTQPKATTAAARLIERARTSYDMRCASPENRLRDVVALANRPGIAQDDEVLAEIEQAVDDKDEIVREVALLATIQIHRFRALRLADLEISHQSVKKLAQIDHPAVIPVLIEVLDNPRKGFFKNEDGPIEADNERSRVIALLRLVEWHTPEAQFALRMHRFDLNPDIVKLVNQATDLFPDEWTKPLSKTEE